MQSNNSFLNDFAKIMSGAFGTAQGLQKEASEQFKQFLETQIIEAGFVRKDDFIALEQRFELLVQKVNALEINGAEKSEEKNKASDKPSS